VFPNSSTETLFQTTPGTSHEVISKLLQSPSECSNIAGDNWILQDDTFPTINIPALNKFSDNAVINTNLTGIGTNKTDRLTYGAEPFLRSH
jgi:hypothetical protein